MSDVLDLPLRALFTSHSAAPASESEIPGVDQGWPGFGGADAPGASVSPAAPGSAANADALLHGAVFALAARELAGLVRALPLDRAAAALRDRDPAAAVGGLLADAAVVRAAAAAVDDPLGLALLQGARRKRELLEAAGGAWATGAVAGHLGITRQGVDKRRQTGTLLGVRLPGGEWAYPVAQFDVTGAPVPGLADALGALRVGGVTSGWTQLGQLLAPDSALSPRAVAASHAAQSHARPGGTRPGRRATAVSAAAARADADATPRSALQVLREDGARARPAVLAALRQAGDLDSEPDGDTGG